MRCYDQAEDFEMEELGGDAWLTGCPLCGGNCWEMDKDVIEQIDRDLDKAMDE